MARLTSALLRRAARIAGQQTIMNQLLTEAFRERYGTTYSDVDADSLIDALDYGVARAPNLAECDRIMEVCGAPRLRKGDSHDG